MPGINDLDTSLPLQHYNGPSAYDNALKGQQISSMLTEQNLQKQTLATQQAQMARQGQMRGVMAQNAGNPDQTATAMTQAGLGPEAQQYQQTQAENTYKLAQAKWNDAHAQFMMNNVSPGMQKTVDQQHINGANAARMFLQEFPDPTKAYTDPVTAQNMKTAYERDYYPMMKGITNMGELLPPQYSDGAYTKMQIAAKMYPDIKDEEAGAKATTAGAAVTSAGAKADLVPIVQQNADTNATNAATKAQAENDAAALAKQKADQLQTYQNGMLKIGAQRAAKIPGISPADAVTLSEAIKEGKVDPYHISSRNAPVLAAAYSANPDQNLNDLAAQAKYENSTGTSNQKALLSNMYPLIDKVRDAGTALANGNNQFVNGIKNWVAEKSGDPRITSFDNLRDETVMEMQKALTGAGVSSDTRYTRAIDNLKSAQSQSQLNAALSAMNDVTDSRLGAIKAGPNPNSAKPGLTPARPGQSPQANTVIKVGRDAKGNLVIQ